MATSVYAAGPVIEDGILQGDLVLYGRGDPTFGPALLCDGHAPCPGSAIATPSPGSGNWPQPLARRGVRSSPRRPGGRRQLVRRRAGPPRLGQLRPQLVVRGAGLRTGLQRQQRGHRLETRARRWTPRRCSELDPDLGDVTLENRTRTVAPGGETDIGDRMYREPGTLQSLGRGHGRSWTAGAARNPSPCRTRISSPPAPSGGRWQRPGSACWAPPEAPPTRCAIRRGAARRRRWPRPRVARCATGSSRSSTPARTGTPTCCSSSWVGSSATGGSWREGIAVERRFLIDSMGIDSTLFALADGSGLSASNLVAPLAFTRLLPFIRRHPHYRANFEPGLPRSGDTGIAQEPVPRHPDRGQGPGQDREHLAGEHPVGLLRAAGRPHIHLLGAGQPSRPGRADDDGADRLRGRGDGDARWRVGE